MVGQSFGVSVDNHVSWNSTLSVVKGPDTIRLPNCRALAHAAALDSDDFDCSPLPLVSDSADR